MMVTTGNTDQSMLTYNYETGQITRDFHLKRLEGDCKRDPERTVNIGVMCRSCPFYNGELKWRGKSGNTIDFDRHEHLVKCKFYQDDDPGLQEVVSDMYRKFEEKAITHYYD